MFHPSPRRHLAAALLIGILGTAGFHAVTPASAQSSSASTAAPERPSAFAPMSPCRLIDTRPESSIGRRTNPVGPGESHVVDISREPGQCLLADVRATGTTALALNVTAVRPTAASFLTVHPGDVEPPNASSLNWVAGQAPTPNKVEARLGADGTIGFFNAFGQVDLVVDVVGTYHDMSWIVDSLDRLGESLADVQDAVGPLSRRVESIERAQADSLVSSMVVGSLELASQLTEVVTGSVPANETVHHRNVAAHVTLTMSGSGGKAVCHVGVAGGEPTEGRIWHTGDSDVTEYGTLSFETVWRQPAGTDRDDVAVHCRELDGADITVTNARLTLEHTPTTGA